MSEVSLILATDTQPDNCAGTSLSDTDSTPGTTVDFQPPLSREKRANLGLRRRRGARPPPSTPGESSSPCSLATTGPPCSVSARPNGHGASPSCRPACPSFPITAKVNSSSPWPTGKPGGSDTCTSAGPLTTAIATAVSSPESSCSSAIVPASWKPAGSKVSDSSAKPKCVTLSTAGSLTSLAGSSKSSKREFHVPRKGTRYKFKDRTLKSAMKKARRVNPNLEKDRETLEAGETNTDQVVLHPDDPDAGSGEYAGWEIRPQPRKHREPDLCRKNRHRQARRAVESGSTKIPSYLLAANYGGLGCLSSVELRELRGLMSGSR